VQAAFTSSIISSSYPYSLFWYPEVPLYYNYGYHIETAFSFLLTSIPLDILHVRIYPIYILFLLIFSTFSFCKAHFQGKSITGGLAVLGGFCVVGYDGWSATLFLNTLPMGVSLVGSAAVAITIFLILMDRIGNILNSKDFSYLDCAFILFLFFVGAMSRSAFAPIIIGGVSFLIVTEFLRTLKISSVIRLCILNFLMGFSFLIVLVCIYGIFSSTSATGMLKFVPQNTYLVFSVIPAWLFSFTPTLHQHQNLIHALASLISIIFISGYLFIGFYYQIFQWIKNGIKKLELLLFYCALTGAVIWNFTSSPGGSNHSFYHYSLLIGAIFGANGTYLLFKDTLKTKRNTLLLLFCLSTTALCAKGYEIYDELRQQIYWQLLSFNRPPKYEVLSQEIISSIETLTEKKKNIVIVSLLPFTCLLNTKLNNIPVYQEEFLRVARTWNVLSSSSTVGRVTNIITALNEAIINLDDKSINTFKTLFPGKEIIFFTLDTQKISSNSLTPLSKGGGWKVFAIK